VSAVLLTPPPEPHVDWTSPAALWDQFNGAAGEGQRRIFRTPAILRFATDTYMDELIAVMANEPHRLAERLAVPEKWTSPIAEPEPTRPRRGLIGQLERARALAVKKLAAREDVRSEAWNAAPAAEPLKLYQPAAQRYYVVTACLVCRTLGLPDRPVNTAMDERVAFVLRMLDAPAGAVNPDPASFDELAFVGGAWVPVTSETSLQENEELYLMSPLTYAGDGRKRRMFSGVIPVAKREALLGAAAPAPVGFVKNTPVDPRQMALKLRVLGPWSNLDDTAARAAEEAAPGPGIDPNTDAAFQISRAVTLADANNQIQGISWLILLDLAEWLRENLAPVWTAIATGAGRNGLAPKYRAAYDQLDRTWLNPASFPPRTHRLLDVLRVIGNHAAALEGATSPYPNPNTIAPGWPERFQFVTATAQELSAEDRTARTGVRAQIEQALVGALDVRPASNTPLPAISQANAGNPRTSPWFTVRCVYDRPKCGALAPSVVSAAGHHPRRPAQARQEHRLRHVRHPLRPVRRDPRDDLRQPGAIGPPLPVQAESQGRLDESVSDRDGLLVLHPDHHDLRADPPDDHRQAPRHHFFLDAVLPDLPSHAPVQRQEDLTCDSKKRGSHDPG
jgi:hypothetical protein